MVPLSTSCIKAGAIRPVNLFPGNPIDHHIDRTYCHGASSDPPIPVELLSGNWSSSDFFRDRHTLSEAQIPA